MTSLFLRTLRDDPADAEVESHRLLVRAGYIRRISAGIYSWLPLGYRVLRKVEQIVREEMDAAGAQELLLPQTSRPSSSVKRRGHLACINGLLAYTPSCGVISMHGNWPLIATMDVVVPHARSVSDLLEVLDALVSDDASNGQEVI